MLSKSLISGVIVALTLIVCAQIANLGAQVSTPLANITLLGNHFLRLELEADSFVDLPSFLETFQQHDLSVSPHRDRLLVWQTDPLLERMWLVLFNTPSEAIELPIEPTTPPEFVEVQWLVDSRHAVVRVGEKSEDQRQPHIVQQTWLVDTNGAKVIEWQWDKCDTLIDLIMENEFASLCSTTIGANNLQQQSVILTADGRTFKPDEISYSEIYARNPQNTFEIPSVFSNDLSQVAYVDRSDTIIQPVLIYNALSGKQVEITRFDGTEHAVIQLAYSPTGRYLAIFTSCFQADISNCVEIWDTQQSRLVWDSSQIGYETSGDFSASSIFWLNDETEFLLLGKFHNEFEATFIWHLALDKNQAISQWEVPMSVNYIIEAEP